MRTVQSGELSSATATTWAPAAPPWLGSRPVPAARIIIDNDFAGDPDGLFQLAHHLLSPSLEVRAIISSRMVPLSPRIPKGQTVEFGIRAAEALFDAMQVEAHPLLLRGSEDPLVGVSEPGRSEGSDFIIEEAMREDDLPLVMVCGAGLTELASAYLREPQIAGRMSVVWIGGAEYPGATPAPPGAPDVEYNVGIDPLAARVVLERSQVPLWQVPRDVYRQCIISRAELRTRVATTGPAGRHLVRSLDRVFARMEEVGRGTGETFVLGDSPLVLLTALQTLFEPGTASSRFQDRMAYELDDDGRPVGTSADRRVRVYTDVDVRLIVEDLVAKLTELDRWIGERPRGESSPERS